MQDAASALSPLVAPDGVERIWTCKIGGRVRDLPPGADGPMRKAINEAFERITGYRYEFLFSGWGGSLDECERAVHENRAPVVERRTLEQDIEHAINFHSAENGSDTPDFILAQFLIGCLAAWNAGVTLREEWYGRLPKEAPTTSRVIEAGAKDATQAQRRDEPETIRQDESTP